MHRTTLLLLAIPAWSNTIPLEFEGANGRFLGRAAGYTSFFTDRGVDLRHGAAKVRLSWNGAKTAPMPSGKLQGVSNYMLGEPKDWRIGVPHYSHVAYNNVLPGIGLSFYGKQNQLEFDWNIRPGADPRAIEMRLDGATKLTIDASGDLVASTPWGELRQHKPLAWQQRGATRIPVEARFQLRGDQAFGFSVDHYDANLPLTIDPVLGFSTNLGGNAADRINSVAVTSGGDPIVAGATDSGNMWNIGGTGDPVAGVKKAFFCKLSSGGSSIYFCTFFGNGTEAYAVRLDSSGNIYLGGDTSERIVLSNGPTLQIYKGASDGFLAKFNSTGTTVSMWTYLGGGGTDSVRAMVLSGGNTYVTGSTHSSNFPITLGAPQTTWNNSVCSCPDAFIAKLNSTWSSLVFSTYAGSERDETGLGIEVLPDNSVVVAGESGGFSSPAATQFFTTTYGPRGGMDGFIVQLSAVGTTFLKKISIGGTGTGERFGGVASDSANNIYACGNADSADYPAAGSWLPFSSGTQANLVKISAAGALQLSTPLATGLWVCHSIVRRGSNFFLSGRTYANSIPGNYVPLDASVVTGNSNVFLFKTNPALTGAQYATLIGSTQASGIIQTALSVTDTGAWIGGYIHPTSGSAGGIHSTIGAVQTNSGGGTDEGFLIRTKESADVRVSVRVTNPSPIVGRQLQFTITVNNDGPDVADAVSIAGATPAGLTLQSATINGVNCQAPLITTLTCNAGEILSGAQAVAVVTYNVGNSVAPGTTVNFTTSATSLVYDPNSNNNTASVAATAP
ncbi:MAG: DUF11 domain-containing protein [Acidobacteria bacterium]|nr:DUF11 domain-containing protein [Acidobacteriota bacterium]